MRTNKKPSKELMPPKEIPNFWGNFLGDQPAESVKRKVKT